MRPSGWQANGLSCGSCSAATRWATARRWALAAAKMPWKRMALSHGGGVSSTSRQWRTCPMAQQAAQTATVVVGHRHIGLQRVTVQLGATRPLPRQRIGRGRPPASMQRLGSLGEAELRCIGLIVVDSLVGGLGHQRLDATADLQDEFGHLAVRGWRQRCELQRPVVGAPKHPIGHDAVKRPDSDYRRELILRAPRSVGLGQMRLRSLPSCRSVLYGLLKLLAILSPSVLSAGP